MKTTARPHVLALYFGTKIQNCTRKYPVKVIFKLDDTNRNTLTLQNLQQCTRIYNYIQWAEGKLINCAKKMMDSQLNQPQWTRSRKKQKTQAIVCIPTQDYKLISTDFGVDSASRSPFRARTDRQTDRQTQTHWSSSYPRGCWPPACITKESERK